MYANNSCVHVASYNYRLHRLHRHIHEHYKIGQSIRTRYQCSHTSPHKLVLV